MSEYLVKKSTLQGDLVIPASKSQTLRAILFAALAEGRSTIHNYLPSPDTLAMIKACQLFGASIEVSSKKIEIEGIKGIISSIEDVVHAGNSGIVLRFCTAVAALSCRPAVVTGDFSIRHQRPMKPMLDALSQLGVSATSMRGDHYAPLILNGPILAGSAIIQGEDSQHVSALLIAAAFVAGPIELRVTNPGELPWVALTLDWFDRLGILYENHGFEMFRLIGPARYPGFEYVVPGDLSSLAFPVAAALVTNSEVTIHNVDLSDCQGDKELVAIFQKMGANIESDPEHKILRVKKGRPLLGISVDINDCVDAITILAVVACFAEGETHIKNAAVAAQKECNRILGITEQLGKMGADITATPDGLIIKKSSLKGSMLESYQDHRMLMSLAVAGLAAEGESTIASVECVSKTFPTFVQDFTAVGAAIEERL